MDPIKQTVLFWFYVSIPGTVLCVCGLRKQPMFTGPLLGSPIWGTLYHEPSADYRSYDLVFLHLNLSIEIFATFRCCCCFFHQPFIYPINRLGYFLKIFLCSLCINPSLVILSEKMNWPLAWPFFWLRM